MSNAIDGHYFKDAEGITQGPLTKEEFDASKVKGRIKPGMKAWRQENGAIFLIQVQRHYTIGKIFSLASCGYAVELSMITCSLIMILFVFNQPKMQEELAQGSRRENYFLLVLCLLTIMMTILSIRTTMGRLADSSSTIISGENLV